MDSEQESEEVRLWSSVEPGTEGTRIEQRVMKNYLTQRQLQSALESVPSTCAQTQLKISLDKLPLFI